MPTSTSNSSERAPDEPWLRIWVTALVLTGLGLGAVETLMRSWGFHPTIVNSPDLWSYHRKRVYSHGDKTVVLLGTSRMQAGFSSETFQRRYPRYNLVQLAVSGKWGTGGTLQDLADDQKFRGVVICSASAHTLLRKRWNDQSEYYSYRHAHPASTNVNGNLLTRKWLQGKLVIMQPQLNLINLVRNVLDETPLPEPRYLETVHIDRTLALDFSIAVSFSTEEFDHYLEEKIRHFRAVYNRNRLEGQDEWVQGLRDIGTLVQKIKSRGGNVLFLRMPSTGERWELENEFFPKEEYWDTVGRITGANTLHFQDSESLSKYQCLDQSHLDVRDVPSFTDDLIDELIRKGILPESDRSNVIARP